MSLKDNNKNKFILTDLSGKEIRSFDFDVNNKNSAFPVEDVSNGVYFYKILSSDKLISNGKLVIIH